MISGRSVVQSISRSFNSLPLWVRFWIAGWLVPVNAASIFLLGTPVGLWTAISAGLVGVSNTWLALRLGGLSRALAFPHLVVWIPLCFAIAARLAGPDAGSIGRTEYIYGVVVLTTNILSIGFDLVDAYRWIAGERSVPGQGSTGPV
ncbi:MAG: hypothetical protein IPK75_13685 [Acidobacteria bacterium]|nr:hypothetical protein [Acidobacteriota bacterium]